MCYPDNDGVLVYRDSNHLTESYTKILVPALEQKLLQMLGRARSGFSRPSGTGSELDYWTHYASPSLRRLKEAILHPGKLVRHIN